MTLIEEKTNDIENNSKLAHAKVHELHEIANKTISHLDGRVAAIEAAGRDDEGRLDYPSGPKNLVPAKNMIPAKPGKVGEWKRNENILL